MLHPKIVDTEQIGFEIAGERALGFGRGLVGLEYYGSGGSPVELRKHERVVGNAIPPAGADFKR
jgi:hypothetical protein